MIHNRSKHLNTQTAHIVSMAQLMTKRIPVSEDMWKRLGKLKEAGQTYDELLERLLQSHNRRELAVKLDAAKKGKSKWTNLNAV
ncbi:MAG: putative CopG family antitoxin [Candidatus Woesearchaeota archaeon]|jgi:predicted CopG family antitoxin